MRGRCDASVMDQNLLLDIMLKGIGPRQNALLAIQNPRIQGFSAVQSFTHRPHPSLDRLPPIHNPTVSLRSRHPFADLRRFGVSMCQH